MTDEDARLLAAMAMVLSVGWRLFGPAALAAAGLEASKPNHYVDRVAHYVQLLGRQEVAPEPAPLPKRTGGRRKTT